MSDRRASPAARLRGLARRLRRDRLGAVTVEFVVWLPMFFIMATAFADISYRLTFSANVQQAALDTVYAMSRHQISAAEAEAYLKSLLHIGDPADISVQATMGANAVVLVTRAEDTAYLFSIFDWVVTYVPDGHLAKATMLAEPV